jgi:hypothetical protein
LRIPDNGILSKRHLFFKKIDTTFIIIIMGCGASCKYCKSKISKAPNVALAYQRKYCGYCRKYIIFPHQRFHTHGRNAYCGHCQNYFGKIFEYKEPNQKYKKEAMLKLKLRYSALLGVAAGGLRDPEWTCDYDLSYSYVFVSGGKGTRWFGVPLRREKFDGRFAHRNEILKKADINNPIKKHYRIGHDGHDLAGKLSPHGSDFLQGDVHLLINRLSYFHSHGAIDSVA